MACDTLLVDRDGPLARITLNRPTALNALNRRLLEELAQAGKPTFQGR